MKFIVDAQLPKSLCQLLRQAGYDCIHTLDMEEKNRTSDEAITQLSLRERRVLISKDVDFYNRFLLKVEPHKLIYLTTGNISNSKLLDLFKKNISKIIEEVSYNQVIEISQTSIITIL